MPDLAGSILSQMAMAGQPREFTSTTEMTQQEPFNIGSLGIILALLLGEEGGLFGKKKPEGEFPGAEYVPPGPGLQFTELAQTPMPPPTAMPSGLPPTMGYSGMSPTELLSLILQQGG